MGIPRAVLLLGPVLTLALLPSNLVATALPLLRDEWDVSAAAGGWVFGAYQLGYVAGVLWLLPLTDRAPLRRVIVGCSALSAVAFLGFPLLAVDVWSAAALRVLAGVGLAGVYMPGLRLVAAEASDARRGLAVALYVSTFYLGSALSLSAAGALLPPLGWRGTALALGALQLAALPLAWLGTRDAPPPRGRSARLDVGVLRHRPVRAVILAYTGHCWELYISRAWVPAFLASVLVAGGMGALEAAAEGGKWAGAMAALGMFGVWLGGGLSDRLGRARTATAIAAAGGAVACAFGWLGGLGWVVVVLVGCLYAVLVSADSSIYSTAVTEWAPEAQIGSAQAVQSAVGFGAAALAPVVAGAALDHGGGYGAVFLLAGLATLGGAAQLLPLAWRAAVPSKRA